ncbi:MAG TPA: hypothetical protein PKD61_29925 [Polyangiaceae bacterium]|nr:hypothetical protein [Polyangiaceae bacterium]
MNKWVARLWGIGTLAALCVLACSADGGGANSGGAPGSGGAASGGGSASGGAIGLDGGTVDASLPPAVAQLKGKVVAPQGTMPISGALVYLGPTEPIPDGTYCDRCVALPPGVPFTFTKPDGTFDLGAYTTGTQSLVVQKGQFRRIRNIDVTPGDVSVPIELTTLPKKTDVAAGDNIPKMAVVQGAWDALEVTLAKLGLGELEPGFLGIGSQLKAGSAAFTMVTNRNAFLSNPAELAKYHVVFIPCHNNGGGASCDDTTSGDATIQKNLQDFVAAGGKLYVTDYSYDYLAQPFPGYVDWIGQTSQIGSACQGDSYNAAATIKDPSMQSWLAALGVSAFEVEDSWTIIDKVNAVQTTDLDGNPTTVTPTVWVEGAVPSHGTKPTTVSFVRSCGRVLFSTYHTEAGNAPPNSPLKPQEAALLYVLLEVGVCVTPSVPR